jgi:PAS domain S-box-containing protein
MGGNAINLLMVEESADDARRVLAALKRKGQPPFHLLVNTKDAFLAALRSQPWDAVIADYVLPNFSGPEALHLLRKLGLDTPFIMLSGIYGEEEAVRTLKAGANDYLMKGNLARLAPALDREILAARDRRRRQRAEAAMQFLAALVDSCTEAIYGKNPDGQIVSWNPGAERLFGYSAAEIIGQPSAVLFPPQRRDEMLEILAAIQQGEVVGERVTERLHKNGRLIPVAVTISPVKNLAGNVIGASSIARDISRERQIEAEREHFRQKLTAVSQELQTLSRLLPICPNCRQVREDQGYWREVEAFFTQPRNWNFPPDLCLACAGEYEHPLPLRNT